jgi:hypothetical protein
MPKTVTLSGTTYTLPQQNDEAPWGENLSELIEALVTAVDSINGDGDILDTEISIANNQSSVASVTGLTFDVGTVRSAVVTYSVYRSTTLSEKGECGILLLTYLSTANAWNISRYSNDDSGIVFTVTDAGQVQYTTDNMSGASYTGTLTFKADAFVQ